MARPAAAVPPAPTSLDLLTIGEPMVLLLADAGLPLAVADRYVASVAGAEVTVAVGARRLGLRTGYQTRIGADPLGQVVLRRLRAEGVQLFVEVDPDRPTGVLIRDMPATGRTTVQYYRAGSAASALSVADLPEAVIDSSRLLHLTGITAMISDSAAGAAAAAMAQARAAGRFVTFDPNVRRKLGTPEQWTERIAPLAAASDIVLAGADELAAAAGPEHQDDPIVSLLAAGVGVVVVKDGIRGAAAHTADGVVSAPAAAVHAVDSVGAGDAFAAGFLSRLLAEYPNLRGGQVPELDALRRALRAGSVVAAAAVAVAGDLDGLPFAASPALLDALPDDDVQR